MVPQRFLPQDAKRTLDFPFPCSQMPLRSAAGDAPAQATDATMMMARANALRMIALSLSARHVILFSSAGADYELHLDPSALAQGSRGPGRRARSLTVEDRI